MVHIVGVKFRKKLRLVVADAGELQLAHDDTVMVETKSGPLLGKIAPQAAVNCAVKNRDRAYPRVLRKAEEDDIRQEELNIRMERDYFRICQTKIQKHGLPMKLVDVEIASDGSKVIFFFVAENRVDFRALVKELAGDLRTRIEMRQIGARSEAQRVGGIGCCGRELCCASFLQKFCPVTVKMTKEQGLPLDPEKISGVCGRLMCCLSYEYENYVKLKEGLPKLGKKIMTPQGPGKIKQINVLTKKILVDLENGIPFELETDDYRPDMLIKQK